MPSKRLGEPSSSRGRSAVNFRPLDQRLVDVLPPGSLYVVGGRVRDELRAELAAAHDATAATSTVASEASAARSAVASVSAGVADSDYVVTGVALDDLVERLSRLGRVDRVGAAFSILKLTTGGETADVALPRRERSTGLGHRDFDVQGGPDVPLAEDLARRDFRMNMIARALPSGELVDPYAGEADIRARRIDILTPATFEEDPLRMLRAAQFAARFAYDPTEATRQAMTAAAPLVATVSAERVSEEFAKLLTLAKRPSIGLELLRKTGVLHYLWPELLEGVGVAQNEWHAYDVWYHGLATLDASPPGDMTLRLAALLHDVGKPRTKDGPHFYRHEVVGADMARQMLTRFRFSNETSAAVERLVRQHMFSADPTLSDAAVRRFVRRIGVANTERLFALRDADVLGSGLPKRGDHNERFAQRVRAEIARKPAFSVTDLAVDGNDVVEIMIERGVAPRGFRGDRRVGTALAWLFEQVTDAPERNERSALLRLLHAYWREPEPRTVTKG